MPWEAEGASDCARGSPGHRLVELLAAGGLGLCLGCGFKHQGLH